MGVGVGELGEADANVALLRGDRVGRDDSVDAAAAAAGGSTIEVEEATNAGVGGDTMI